MMGGVGGPSPGHCGTWREGIPHRHPRPRSFSSPLATSPPEPPPSEKAPGFWDLFATKWQQASGPDKGVPPPEPGESPGEPPGDDGSDLREPEEGAFRWGFLAGKLAEIRNKNAPKSN